MRGALWVLVATLVLGLAATPAASASSRLPLHACKVHGVSARCGRLSVPENRAVPGGGQISLRVVVLRGPGWPHRADPLFVLAGGPGDAATDYMTAFAPVLNDAGWQRDVVLVDQRGTGGSRPLVCPELRGVPAGGAADAIRACTERLGADLTQYGTVAAMRDIDAVRAALGYPTINVFGVSYGVTAAQIYLRLYPARVRTLLLDSGMLLGTSLDQTPAWQQRALDLLAGRCARDGVCASRFPTWYADLPGLLARLRSQPVGISVAGTQVTLDPAVTESTIYWLTRSAGSAASVPLLVYRAVAGDYGPLAQTAHELSRGLEEAIPPSLLPLAISCNEPWARIDTAALAAAARGTYVEDLFAADAASPSPCGAIPRWSEPASLWTPVHSKVPALALSGEADPVLPPSSISDIARTMPNSRLVVVPGQGHAVSWLPCVPGLIERFLVTRNAKTLDARCVRSITPPGWPTG